MKIREERETFAMDLTPLVEDPSLGMAGYVLSLLDRFRAGVARRVPGGTVTARQALGKSSTAARTDLKVHALLRLKMSEDAKQVLGRRVAHRSKHPHEAVGGDEALLRNAILVAVGAVAVNWAPLQQDESASNSRRALGSQSQA
jgi:hypothetical protein